MIKTEKFILMAKFVDRIIREHFWSNGETVIIGFDDLDNSECEKLIETGKTLLLARDGVHMYPGHFIDALLNNNLKDTFDRADKLHKKAIHWFILIEHNIEKLNR